MKKAIVLFTIVSIINTFVGCAYTNKQTRVDENNPVPSKKISAVVLIATLDGFVQSSGDTVFFENGSGVYDKNAKIISGKLVDGKPVSASVDELEWVRLKEETPEGNKLFLVDRATFLSHAEETPWYTIDGSSRQAGTIISFRKFGAQYDYASQLIKGVTDDGKRVEIEADRVYSVEIKKFSPGKLLLSTAFIGLTAYVVSALLFIASLNHEVKSIR